MRVTGPSEIAFPDYDGNGMFKSLGNIVVNADVGLLFIAMHDKPKRLRVNGSARVSDSDPLLAETVGAQLIVRVTARAIFPNCPRYIPTMGSIEPSIYAPPPDRTRRSRRGRVLRTSRTASTRASRRFGVRRKPSASDPPSFRGDAKHRTRNHCDTTQVAKWIRACA